jgi:hypothetical protein
VSFGQTLPKPDHGIMIRELHFVVKASEPPGKGYIVQLLVDGNEEATGKFSFQKTGEAVAGDLEYIDIGNPTYDAVRHVGELLWLGLTDTAGVREACQRLLQERRDDVTALVRLSTPPELGDLPWEALYIRDLGFLCGRQASAVVHAPRSSAWIPPFPGPRPGPLRMLIVIPERSGLRVSSEREVIERAFSGLGFGPATVLDGRVTAERLHESLQEHWDLIHFMGHSRSNADQRIELDLNLADGTVVPYDGEEFATDVAISRPYFVVMNSCSGDTGREADELAGFGSLLMRSGVPAVVAMRYSIADNEAVLFAKYLYEQLLAGPRPGRVDRAVEEARAALRRGAGPDGQRAFITPVLHLAAGYEQLFTLASPQAGEVEQALETDQEEPASRGRPILCEAARLPEALRAALQQGRCIPVIGSGILRSAAPRSRPAPSGPLELAHIFAGRPRPEYPRKDDFALCERAGEWMNAQLLQWVSQYYEKLSKGRGELIDEIQRHYSATPAPEVIGAISRWKVPLLFYTHFDGYLEECVLKGESWLQNVVYEFDKPLASTESRASGPRSLVLLRSSYQKTDVSFALTEDDHDELLGRIARLHPTIRDTPRRPSHCVLFLEVSPRDPVIRQLSQQILESGSRRAQGPTFFAWPNPDDVDRAYWEKYNVEWLHAGTSALVRLISEACA